MPALYSHTTRATGTVLTATIYNGDHQNHIDNGVPGQLDDYSNTVGQMQTATDPGGVGTESLATSLAGELERIRFVLKQLSQGAQWYSGGAVAGLLGYSRVHGQTGTNNSGTPLTQYDFAADAVVLRSSAGGTVVRTATGTVTNNISTAGPAANGRDQAGAFSASSWVHFYWVWNGTTLATVSSAVAPPTGPTLPTGYTHWAYICALRLNASTQFLRTFLRGRQTYYADQGVTQILVGGGATVETSVSTASLVPPNALTALLYMDGDITTNASGVGNVSYSIRVLTGVNAITKGCILQIANNSSFTPISDSVEEIPNIGQSIFYIWVNTTSAAIALNLFIHGYTNPNGDA